MRFFLAYQTSTLIVLYITVAAAQATKSTECYLGLLYVEDVAVYGYMTPLKVKIVIALELSDAVVRDADVIAVRLPPSPSFTLLTSTDVPRGLQIFRAPAHSKIQE